MSIFNPRENFFNPSIFNFLRVSGEFLCQLIPRENSILGDKVFEAHFIFWIPLEFVLILLLQNLLYEIVIFFFGLNIFFTFINHFRIALRFFMTLRGLFYLLFLPSVSLIFIFSGHWVVANPWFEVAMPALNDSILTARMVELLDHQTPLGPVFLNSFTKFLIFFRAPFCILLHFYIFCSYVAFRTIKL